MPPSEKKNRKKTATVFSWFQLEGSSFGSWEYWLARNLAHARWTWWSLTLLGGGVTIPWGFLTIDALVMRVKYHQKSQKIRNIFEKNGGILLSNPPGG